VADSGVKLSFMAGNRDFLVGTGFAQAAGLELLPDPYRCMIAGMPTLLSHGDALCTDDADYQRFRATVRAPEWRAAFLARPLAQRKHEIEALRARSEAEKRIKPMAIMDVNADAVAVLLRAHDVRTLIHGHTHRQARHALTVDGRDCMRWVLGDWHPDRGGALACRGADWRFS
jgi:UDP-2,3-diacylglucosamine hydrolase